MASVSRIPTANQRLDSWKEIAAFFGCDERTVRRWEKERGLPVHRLPGGSRGKVFAYSEELTRWLNTSDSQRQQGTESFAVPVAAIPINTPQPSSTAAGSSPYRRWLYLPPILALLFAAWLFRPAYRLAHAGRLENQTSSASVTRPINSDAEELYLKGRYYWNKRTPESLNKAVDYFTQAIVRDPNFAEAYVGLADCYNLLREYTMMPSGEAYPRALAAAKKAVELDPQSSDAHASLAFASFYGSWDITAADREFQRSLELNPNNAVAHHWYANYLSVLRHFPEALKEMERARALEPSSTSLLADQGILLYTAGLQAQGTAQLKQLELSEPNFLSPHRYLKVTYFDSGDYPNYIAEAKKESGILHDKSGLAIAVAAEKGLAEGGRKGMLQNILVAKAQLYKQGLISPVTLACSYAAAQDRDETMHYLNLGYDQHDEGMIYLRQSATFDFLQNDPAYRELLARIGLPAD